MKTNMTEIPFNVFFSVHFDEERRIRFWFSLSSRVFLPSLIFQTLLDCTHSLKIVNMWDKDCNTSLHIACANGYETIAKMLIDKDADVQSRNNDEKTPLHLAAYYGQTELVHILNVTFSFFSTRV